MTEEIRLVPVRELMRNLTDSYDDYDLSTAQGWLDMLAEKSADSDFPAPLRALQAEGQKDPIAVGDWHTRDGEPIWEMGNGHHRLTAAILLGWDTVAVVFTTNATDRRSGYGSPCHYDYVEAHGVVGDKAAAWELSELVAA